MQGQIRGRSASTGGQTVLDVGHGQSRPEERDTSCKDQRRRVRGFALLQVAISLFNRGKTRAWWWSRFKEPPGPDIQLRVAGLENPSIASAFHKNREAWESWTWRPGVRVSLSVTVTVYHFKLVSIQVGQYHDHAPLCAPFLQTLISSAAMSPSPPQHGLEWKERIFDVIATWTIEPDMAVAKKIATSYFLTIRHLPVTTSSYEIILLRRRF